MSDENPILLAKQVFLEALEVPAADRAAFVRDRCAADSDLRRRVETLLGADANADELERVIEGGAEHGARMLVGQCVRGYRLLRVLASGGMGTVYEAEQDNPRRRVAIKMLRSSLVSPALMRRFQVETEILARLDHPHIARIYEAGWHDTGAGGVPWFAMDLVEDARPLTAYADDEELDVPTRLRLFATVCDAVHFGHGRGFIHRDLKPGNILVDRSGSPRIIDFGVARSTDSDLSIATLHTTSGELLGTIRYMSPEQCAGDASAVDLRSDVYALGVVLYELLTGALPYDVTATTSVFDLPRMIRESDAPRLGAIDRALRGDIETIVARCLQKDPARRYATVADVANDIRRHLAGETIEARRDNTLYVAARTLRRHRVATATAAAFVLLMASAIIALSVLYARSEERAETLRRREYVNAIALAASALEDDDIPHMLELLARCPDDLRGWEWWYLCHAADDATIVFETADLSAADRDAYWLPFAARPDGSLAAIAGPDGVVHLWDCTTARVVRTLAGHEHPVVRLAFSRDGARLATREARARSGFRIWDVETGLVQLRGEVGQVWGSHCLSPDGRHYIAADHMAVTIFDIDAGEVVHRIEGDSIVTAVAMTNDGRLLAAGGYDRSVRLFDVTDGFRPLRVIPAGERWVQDVSFSPDGTRLLWGDAVGQTREVDVTSGAVVRVFDRQSDKIVRCTWSPDGRLILVSTTGAIDVRAAVGGARIARFHGGGWLGPPVFLDDARRIAVAGSDRRLRLIDLDGAHAQSVIGRDGGRIATSPNGRWAATALFDHAVQLWDLEASALAARWPAHVEASKIQHLAFGPHGGSIATAANDGTIRIWSVPDGTELLALEPLDTPVIRVAWTPDGEVVFGAARDASVAAWSARTGARLARFQPDASPPTVTEDYYAGTGPRTIAVSPDGHVLATSGHEGTIRLWAWPGLQPFRTIEGHATLVRWIEFSPDGTLLATASQDGTIALWDVGTGTRRQQLEDRGQRAIVATFSPDGRRLLTSSGTSVFRLWEVATGTQMLLLTGHTAAASEVAFSGDGRRIVSSGSDGDVRVWDAPGFVGAVLETTP
ncbi:MAG: serine/threonine protein kinase [Phycisphaerae bacterium]|nr:serine/threonine protein kinase [Phycisphaerae bacterium]